MKEMKMLERLSLEDSVKAIEEAVTDPQTWAINIKKNQLLGLYIMKLFSKKWNDELKVKFKDVLVKPFQQTKEKNQLQRIIQEVDLWQDTVSQEMWVQSYMKIVNQRLLMDWKIVVVFGVPYREEYKWKIKYKNTLCYTITESMMKELVKKYDILDKSFVS